MIHWLMAALAAARSTYYVTIGTSGGSAGWDNSGTTFGSITPGAPPVPGAPGEFFNTINTVVAGGADLSIICDTAGLLQTDFTTIHIQDGTGAWRSYNSADASSFSNSGVTLWTFGDGTDDVWELADDGEIHGVYFL